MSGIRLVVSDYKTKQFQIELNHVLQYRQDGEDVIDLRPEIARVLRDAAAAIEKAKELVFEGDINDLRDVKGVKVGDWSIELLANDK